MNNDRRIDTKFIDVIDGIRAISIIIVLIFHFWQQTWIFPEVQIPALSWLGITKIDINSLARVGYLFVDMMVLLSGFLLFLPLARHILCGESMLKWKQYAKKRVARILPSYLFSVLAIFFLIELPAGSYSSTWAAVKDLITHLTFTQTLWVSTYLSTKLNVVLWTVAIEVWFYILFPFIAKFIGRRGDEPADTAKSLHKVALVYLIMNAIAWFYIYRVTLSGNTYLSMYINQLPAFLGVYANGMVGAMLYVSIAKDRERTLPFEIVNTVIAIASLFIIGYFVNDCAASSEAQVWQVTERFKLSFAFIVFILSAAFSMKWFRWLFSNKLMRFLSGISYNLYIWHQWLAVKLKNPWRIPYWEGTTPPNQLYDKAWMWKYAAVIVVASLVAAILTTYLIEKPMAKLIMRKSAPLKIDERNAA